MGNSSKKHKQKCLIVSRHGLTTQNTLPNQPNKANAVRVITFFLTLRFVLTIARQSTSFIMVHGCGVRVLRCLKEKLAWVIEKWFQFTTPYYTIPLDTCKEAINKLAINQL